MFLGGLSYCLNAALNGLKLQRDPQIPASLEKDETITDFYGVFSGMTHGWVTLRTNGKNVYKCHLIGSPNQLFIEIVSTNWDPRHYEVTWQPTSSCQLNLSCAYLLKCPRDLSVRPSCKFTTIGPQAAASSSLPYFPATRANRHQGLGTLFPGAQ